MNPEAFHVIQEILDEPYGPAMVVSIVILLPVGLAFGYWVYRRRVHPVLVWAIASVAWFGASQIFPENRSKVRELAMEAPVVAAVATAVTFYVIRRHRRDVEARRAGAESGK